MRLSPFLPSSTISEPLKLAFSAVRYMIYVCARAAAPAQYGLLFAAARIARDVDVMFDKSRLSLPNERASN